MSSSRAADWSSVGPNGSTRRGEVSPKLSARATVGIQWTLCQAEMVWALGKHPLPPPAVPSPHWLFVLCGWPMPVVFPAGDTLKCASTSSRAGIPVGKKQDFCFVVKGVAFVLHQGCAQVYLSTWSVRVRLHRRNSSQAHGGSIAGLCAGAADGPIACGRRREVRVAHGEVHALHVRGGRMFPA